MSDDEVLALLGSALAPEQREPPLSSVLALRRAVDGGAGVARSRWWHHRAVAAGAVFGAVMTASTTAFALNGAILPRPIRIVSHGVGLPVDSAALADTRTATGELREALQHHDQARVPQATRLLRTRLSHLAQDEKREVEHEAAALLTEADQFGEQGKVESQGNATPKRRPVTAPGISASDQGSSGQDAGGHGTSTQTTRMSPTTPTADGRGGEGDSRGGDGQGGGAGMEGGPPTQPAPQPLVPSGPSSHGDSGAGGDSRPVSSGPSGGHAESQPAGD